MKILMYDFARAQGFVESYWRRLLSDVRVVGYTDFAVYIETGIHLPSLPLHRPFGGMTYEQALTIKKLAGDAGLHLHWFSNTLGHCGKLLANDHYRHLAETPDILFQLCPSHPETRPLLREIIQGLAKLDDSDWLHVGLDEAWHLNFCPRCKARGLSKPELYLDHLDWVTSTCKEFGKRPAIWGDMLLTHPEIIGKVDREVLIFDWQYNKGSAATIKRFREAGLDVVASVSTNDYGAAFYPFNAIEQDIAPFVTAARQTGCRGICQCVWEMFNGTLFDNGWDRVAAAPAIYDGKPFSTARFAEEFYGSAKSDAQVLSEFLDQKSLAAIDESLPIRTLRMEVLGHDSAWTIYYKYFHQLYGTPLNLEKFAHLGARVEAARRLVPGIQRAATKRTAHLQFLGVPLDIHKMICDRLTLCRQLRETNIALCPHRLANEEGTRRLASLHEQAEAHIKFCTELAELLEKAVGEVGAPASDAANLRKQIANLKEVTGYIRHHRDTYARGELVPGHELWFV